MLGWDRTLLFVFVSVLLRFYMSWKSFKSGNAVNTEYLNRIPNPESRIPNWGECTEKYSTSKELYIHKPRYGNKKFTAKLLHSPE